MQSIRNSARLSSATVGGNLTPRSHVMRYSRLVTTTVVAATLVSGSALAASPTSSTQPSEGRMAAAARRLGLPPNGPDFMYRPPPALPQLQNRDPHFAASPLMVSGTERYIDGEYQYTDFVYDDDGTTYPDRSDRT